MIHNILQAVENHVSKIYKEKSPPENIYHDLAHTHSVVQSINKIGSASKLSDDELEKVMIAGWFHDIGYIESGENHEEISSDYARKFLESIEYPDDKILQVIDCIMATKIPSDPQETMEKVICDADLHHLGEKEFFDKNELFRTEYEKRNNEIVSEFDWIKRNIDFFTQHKYYTKYAREKYDEQKSANLLKLQKKFRKKLKKLEDDKIKEEKIAVDKEKIEIKKQIEKKAERGIETMFRNTMRTHVSFSSMADSKANIMISVNTLMLGAVATILARKLDTNPHLIIPTLVLSIVCLTTLVFAIMVTRPKITSGTFTKEDIEKKRANLLFFGNFYNMNLKDFTWGMQQMMNDKDYLYGCMINDFYYLGQVLGKKYKNLRICYNIFMYGFIISIILFVVFIALNPGGTHIDLLE